MPADWVIDASVLGAAFFAEDASALALAFLIRGDALIAPDLIVTEMASIASKKVWRGLTTEAVGARSVSDTLEIVPDRFGADVVTHRAFELSAQHRFSVYDATYLALAEAQGIKVVTLDTKLVRRAQETGLGHLVHALD